MTPADRAIAIWQAGVAAADPVAAVQRHLDGVPDPALILAVGKAAGRMAEAALQRFAGVETLVVTNHENAHPVAGAQVLAAGHPVPDAAGQAAARKTIAALRQTRGPVLALISGGGSALLPAPTAPITLAEKAALNAALLGAGLDIRAMNLVRQQVSDLKGGGLLRAAAPNPVTALILSDVVGDDLAVIASGPTVRPIGTAADAIAVLKDAGLWDRVAPSIRRHLQSPPSATDTPEAVNVLVGSNAQSVAAMAGRAGEGRVIPHPVEGDVQAAAKLICDAAGPGVTLWGGETTVRLRGAGKGGRNQELALWIASEARARGWDRFTCLQAGSDGRDGPTDAAGGLVDQDTFARIAAAGGDAGALLSANDSYRALGLADALFTTGATGTNVADLGVLIRDG